MPRVITAAGLDGALQDLRVTESYGSRLHALKLLVQYWHGPIRLSDGYSREELAALPLPSALR